MGEKVKVNVRGIHRDAQGNEMVSETVAFGEYYERAGSHYVLYEETLEEEGESIKTMMKIIIDYLIILNLFQNMIIMKNSKIVKMIMKNLKNLKKK